MVARQQTKRSKLPGTGFEDGVCGHNLEGGQGRLSALCFVFRALFLLPGAALILPLCVIFPYLHFLHTLGDAPVPRQTLAAAPDPLARNTVIIVS